MTVVRESETMSGCKTVTCVFWMHENEGIVGLCLVQQLVKRAVVKRPLLEAET
jgi:hypothetical protein